MTEVDVCRFCGRRSHYGVCSPKATHRYAETTTELSRRDSPDWEEAWKAVSGILSTYRYAAIDLEEALIACGTRPSGETGFDAALLACIKHASETIVRLSAENAKLKGPK
jgi:hypothetical protein